MIDLFNSEIPQVHVSNGKCMSDKTEMLLDIDAVLSVNNKMIPLSVILLTVAPYQKRRKGQKAQMCSLLCIVPCLEQKYSEMVSNLR